MCLSAPKLPKAPPIPKMPTRIEESTSADDLIRKRLSAAQGKNANIKSSPLGDPTYGQNSSVASAKVKGVNVLGVP